MSLWRPLSSSFPSARHRSLISIRATDPCPDECRGQIRESMKPSLVGAGRHPHAGSGLGCWELTPRLHRFLSDLKYIVLGCSWSTVSADTWFSNSPKPPLPRLPALLKDMYSHSFSSHCGFFLHRKNCQLRILVAPVKDWAYGDISSASWAGREGDRGTASRPVSDTVDRRCSYSVLSLDFHCHSKFWIMN